jgi:hypothetical protein
MSSDTENPIRHGSEGGIVARLPNLESLPLAVAPNTTDEKNTLRAPLVPVGCMCLFDRRFAFDCSFVQPESSAQFSELKALIDELSDPKTGRRPPLSLFGHADPTGSDDYNKALSGRRARAVYAVLARKGPIWEDLYTAPLGGDRWGPAFIQTMLKTVAAAQGDPSIDPGAADGVAGPNTQAAVEAYQRKKGLAVDGIPGPQTRGPLYLDYFDSICVGPDGKPYTVADEDMLGRGASGGKGSYQGCSDFNPVLIFSGAEHETFESEQDHADRDAANAPNRRVVAYLFKPGTKADPGSWPCPVSTDGASACRNRFWSDWKARRAYGVERRLYEETPDTFACRFYDRLASGAPCEHGEELAVIRVRLFDAGFNPMPSSPFRLTLDSLTVAANADQNGWVEARVPSTPAQCKLEWGEGDASGSYAYTNTICLDWAASPTDGMTQEALSNFGYGPSDGGGDGDESEDSGSGDTMDPLARFQLDFQIAAEDDAKSTLDAWQADPDQVKPMPSVPPADDTDGSPAGDDGSDGSPPTDGPGGDPAGHPDAEQSR